MASINYLQDYFWESAKGKTGLTPVAFDVLTINPPIGQFVVGGPLGSGPSGTLYPYGLTPSQVSLVSTSPSDTAGGAGARSVLIIGRGGSGLITFEVVALNGTTPVLTVGSFEQVNPFSSVSTVGSNGAPLGDISFTISGVLSHKIRAGFNRDVTSGGTLFSNVGGFFFSITYSANKQTEILFQIRDNTFPDAGFITFDHAVVDHDSRMFTTFEKSPVRAHSNADVQSIIKARYPNTICVITSTGVFVPNMLL